MKGLRSNTMIQVLMLLLLGSCIRPLWGAPQSSFQRRNWTPQAMLYLKGTQTRSQNTEKLSMDQAATVLLNVLQQARGANRNPGELYLQELPVWKRDYF